MNKKILALTVITLLSISFWKCTPDVDDIDINNSTRSIAFPLVNTSVNVVDFERESESGNVTVNTNEEGKVTVSYEGEVVNRDWSVISPPLPVAAFEFKDSITDIVLNKPDGKPLIVDEFINRIEFAEWSIRFQFEHSYNSDVDIHILIPQIKKEGISFETDYKITYEGGSVTSILTDTTSLDGFIFETSENEFQLIYDARLPNGERVELESGAGIFQPFNPSYVEGYLGKGEFPVQGKIIPVNLFNEWKSGGAVFENPSIDLYVENALGLPLAATFDDFSITTVAGDIIPVQAEVIEQGIDLDFPTLSERGETKVTTFSFDKNNSNIKDLFSERVAQVNYDILAIYNIDSVRMDNQYIGEGGYFSANVAVTLPLQGTISELVLQDTVDVDFGDYERVISGEVKSVIENEFPLDLEYQAYFIGADSTIIDSLYSSRVMLEGAAVDGDGIAQPPASQVFVTAFSQERWQKVQNAERLAFDIKLSTRSIDDSPLWVYDTYDVIIKAGALLEVNIN